MITELSLILPGVNFQNDLPLHIIYTDKLKILLRLIIIIRE